MEEFEECSTPSQEFIKHKGLKPLPFRAKRVAFFLLALIAWWFVNREILSFERARFQKALFGRSVNMGAVILAKVLGDKEFSLISELAVQISKEGKFSKVVITDSEGNVIGSTDRRLDNSKIKELAVAPSVAKITSYEGKLRGDISIRNQDLTVGALRIELDSDDH